MKYLELVKVYEKLEKTQSKLEKTGIIAELFEKISTEDLEKVVLLVSGKVFPSYSEHELGIASQLMIKAISRAVSRSVKNLRANPRTKCYDDLS